MRFDIILKDTVMATLGADELARWKLTPETVSVGRPKTPRSAENNRNILSMLLDLINDCERKTGITFRGYGVIAEIFVENFKTIVVFLTKKSAERYKIKKIRGVFMYRFENLENLISFADSNADCTRLFKNTLFSCGGSYILSVYTDSFKTDSFELFNSKISEYAEKIRHSAFFGIYAAEHFKPVIENTALETIRSVFCRH